MPDFLLFSYFHFTFLFKSPLSDADAIIEKFDNPEVTEKLEKYKPVIIGEGRFKQVIEYIQNITGKKFDQDTKKKKIKLIRDVVNNSETSNQEILQSETQQPQSEPPVKKTEQLKLDLSEGELQPTPTQNQPESKIPEGSKTSKEPQTSPTKEPEIKIETGNEKNPIKIKINSSVEKETPEKEAPEILPVQPSSEEELPLIPITTEPETTKNDEILSIPVKVEEQPKILPKPPIIMTSKKSTERQPATERQPVILDNIGMLINKIYQHNQRLYDIGSKLSRNEPNPTPDIIFYTGDPKVDSINEYLLNKPAFYLDDGEFIDTPASSIVKSNMGLNPARLLPTNLYGMEDNEDTIAEILNLQVGEPRIRLRKKRADNDYVKRENEALSTMSEVDYLSDYQDLRDIILPRTRYDSNDEVLSTSKVELDKPRFDRLRKSGRLSDDVLATLQDRPVREEFEEGALLKLLQSSGLKGDLKGEASRLLGSHRGSLKDASNEVLDDIIKPSLKSLQRSLSLY